MKNTDRKSRTGAVRKGSRGPQVGSGGQGRQALEGKKPTPKAEDRPYHPAGKAKAAKDRFAAAGGGRSRAPGGSGSGAPRSGRNTGTGNTGGGGSSTRKAKSEAEFEVVTGRNSVLEALRAKIPASALYVATRIEMDDRVKEVLKLATTRNIPML